MRGNIRIVLDDIDDLPSTSQNIAQNNADDMQRENLEKRNRRLDKDRERKRKNRENESEQGRMERLEQQRIRQKIRRETENEEETEQRLEQDMIRHRIRRETEDEEENVQRLEQDMIRKRIYHKLNLALNPDDGDEPAYGQVFIVDTEEALSAMNRANPVINQNRRLGYNVPRANEVAAVYVPGADGEMPNAKIVVREKGKELRILDNTNQLVSPMTYPLFFPRGTLGWHPDIRQENSIRRVTRLQYVSYSIGIRKEFNPILYGGKLFQQYCVDEYVKIESDRMRWIRSNQKTILADAYKNVDSYLEKRARETGKPLGRKVILPPTVTNSPRYIEKHFQDAM
uniref:Helitron helicase-like domain-containing protein n=1 Tax=Meloidogyne javanica TaxID=6303 RepID=A0A915LIC6_MELJA